MSAGDTSATLTLAYDDTDFDTARTVAVTVGAGAHVLPGPIAATASVAVTPSLEANATPSALTLNEDSNHANNARTFTAALDSLPAATTTVTVASADAGAATVDKASLTFTTTDWNTAQTVTVTAQADDDANDEEVAVTLTEASVGVLATVTVTVTDDDRGTVLIDADPTTAALDPGPLLIDESDGANYTVRLSAAPSATATVALPPLGAIAVTLNQSSLMFTTQNWNTPQTVGVLTPNDGDGLDESITITHTATGGGYGGTVTRLRVSITDDERTGTDFDVDNDGLIEVSTLAQLNAIRWDLDGNGAVSAGNMANYSGASGAFANASTGMGCPNVSNTATCTGYELTRDLDFDTDGDGATHTSGTSDSGDTYHNGGSGWDPLGPSSAPSDSTHFNATFDGNGHSIHNLFVSRNRNYGGLFAALRGGAVVRSLGLPNAYVDISAQGSAAPLAGESSGRVEAAWATGTAAGNTNVGGLLGQNHGVVAASYSKASARCGNGSAAGLVANNTGTIVASYATGAVTGSCAASLKHGLAGGATGTATASHWDREISSVTTSAQGAGRTTAQLQTPTSATGIYAGWADMDVDGDGNPHESPWDFGTDSQYPALSYRGTDPVEQRGDYDLDDDGLIDVYTLAQLNAIRWDMDGDGAPSSGNANSYNLAFPNHATGMGCPTSGGCTGYELRNDLDFDTDGDGATWTLAGSTFTADSGDAYHNGGSGWDPLGTTSTGTHFTAVFDGKGHVIENLLVNRSRGYAGLFAGLRANAVVRSLGLPNARVRGAGTAAGALAGHVTGGRVAAVWSSGAVQGGNSVGGLVGWVDGGTLVAGYSTAAVDCTGTGSTTYAGGLAGSVFGVGGTIAASYSTGTVTGACVGKFGLSDISTNGSVTASYWDTDLSRIADDADGVPPEGEPSADLRAPTGYSSLYAAWDDQDVDGDSTAGVAADADDDAWAFGNAFQWPVLKFGGLDVARQQNLQPVRATVTASRATLTEANLNGARLTVTLPGFTFASGVTAASFALAGSPANIPGLTFTVTGGAAGSSTATLTLATGTGYGFNVPTTLTVRVLAAAIAGRTEDLDTDTVTVTPTPGVTLSRASMALQEDPTFGGGTNRNRGDVHGGAGQPVHRLQRR